MWSTRIITDGGLARTDSGFDVDIRLPWYRSLPLSVIHAITLRLDDVEIDTDRLALSVNGHRYRLDALAKAYDEWWHMVDSGILHASHPQLEPGSSHKIEVIVTFEIPYVPGAVIPSGCTKTLLAA